MATSAAQPSRGYVVKSTSQEDFVPKEITAESIQAMLDENSNLIVEIVGLNTQIKHGKGTAQLSELTDKLDKKRKKLNKNLMTLAKWADESSDHPPQPRPQSTPYTNTTTSYPRAMALNPMAAAPPMGMGHPQMQSQRYAQPTQAQMYAIAQSQYQPRMPVGSHGGYSSVPGAVPRYHDPGMGYAGMPPNATRPMAMAGPLPPGYVGGGHMGYPMAAPHGYGMMAPQGMQRIGGVPDGPVATMTGAANADGR